MRLISRALEYRFWIFIGLLFTVRATLADHYYIPSKSMQPALEVGDHVFVWKVDYRPTHGDVVVFRDVRNESSLMIKRLIALPGDEVEMRGGRLTINGVAATYASLGITG